MPTSFRPYAPDQELLLQPSLREWLPEGHLAYFISDVIEVLDLRAFYEAYEGDGRRKAPFEPRYDAKGADLRVRDGRFFLAQDCQEVGGRCRVPGTGCGQLPAAPDPLPLFQS